MPAWPGLAAECWPCADKSCTMKDVKDRVKELNVQLDNLCQVSAAQPSDTLPQFQSH